MKGEHSLKSNRGARQPTLVSLFTGAGGLDVGLELAGFRTVVAVDKDPDCVSTLRANQGRRRPEATGAFLDHSRILQRSVEDLEPADLRPRNAPTGWTPDLMAGGPPCQPFSSAGKMHSLNDPRGQLFRHFVRLADAVRPKLILFENVRGLVTAKGPTGIPGEAVSLVKESFEEIGYATSFALLNAADCGAPQRRVRLFMLASRLFPLPKLPAPTHSEKAEPSLFEAVKPWVTLGEFLDGRPPPDETDVVQPSRSLAAQLAQVIPGSGLKSPGAREATRPGGHWGYKQGTFVADLARPARTVTAACTQDWVRLRDGRLRRLTWQECAGLQGFPADWEFSGGKASVFRQVGNAVPVVFGQVLGRTLYLAWKAMSRGARKPSSEPFPKAFSRAIEYTLREHRRNGESRRRALALQASGTVALHRVKGLGSEDLRSAD